MSGVKKVLMLVGLMLTPAMSGMRAAAQLATTTVQDTVYRADGTTASGSVVITWNSFTTAGGVAIAAGTTTATLGANGLLSVALAPNAGATPMGSYYTAVFHLNDGTTKRQYWTVPVTAAGGGPATLAAVSTTVLPASVAMQTVTKAYVDNAITAAEAGMPYDASPYVLKAGDTMTGPLNLPADPVSPNQAADMHYVDASVAAVSAGLSGKVSLTPGATQVVAQPSGTQLEVNNLNGDLYATQYVQSPGNNGIGNALASADCSSGCEVKVERTYPGTDVPRAAMLPQYTQVLDARGGSRVHTSADPLRADSNGVSSAVEVSNTSTRSAAQLAALLGNVSQFSYAMELSNNALTGGSNQYPESLGGGIPYFKSTFGVESLVGTYNTQGQHVQLGNQVNCYGIGDCLAGGQFIVSDGGARDSADEGTHPWDLNVTEDSKTFTGTCSAGCTAGSTQLTVTAVTGGGTEGDGRFLIDKNPADVIRTGELIGGSTTFSPLANFSGTNFPVSVFVETAAPAVAQPTNMAPGTVTLPIATSGVPSGFATNTAALPTTGVACLAETIGGLANFEMAKYSVVDATHVQLTLNRVHGTATAMAVGGLCGYGLEETVDTVGAVRQVFPVLGSSSATSLYYAGGVENIVGVKGQTGAFLNDTFQVASISRTGNVVTVTATANFADDVNGLSMTVSGVADSSYDGTYTVTTTGPNTLTYANTGPDSTSSGGSLNVLTGGYALYPMAEVLSVYDTATKSVDGAMTLGANTVAWASGDPLEEPHYHLQRVAADVEYVTQYQPRNTLRQSAGKTYAGKVSNYLVGWEINNSDPATDYIGSGGTLAPPTDAYSVLGYWANDMEVEAGRDAVIRAHCNARGCNRWDSGYALFAMDSATGSDALNFAPQSDTMTAVMGGAAYSFSPASFTAGTINVGTLNATTITGGVSAAAITSGTINAARLPIFGPSGPTHAPGAVPDPGSTAGSTRFLREDGTWQVPTGSGGGGAGSFTTLAATGAINFTGGGTLKSQSYYFGSGTPLLSGPAFEAYLQLNATGANNAGVISNRASTAGTDSLDLLTASTSSGFSIQLPSGSTNLCILDRAVSQSTCRVTLNQNGVFALGYASATQVSAAGSTPTMAAGAAAGSGPSCTTVAGANMAGVVTCTTGSGTSANGVLATVTFNGGMATAPEGCSLMARNAAAASASTTVYTTAPSTTAWSIAVGATALSASTTYSWSYSCI